MKIRKSYLSIALMALTVQTGMAQEQKRDSLDTGKVYEIGEVVVTGTRNGDGLRCVGWRGRKYFTPWIESTV